MPDISGFDPKTGNPVSIPQEAAGQAYREGKIRFHPDTPVPVKLNGISGTMSQHELDAALETGDAELDFDPHGASKAAAAGALRGLTMGGSDWLAVEGTRYLGGGNEGAENVRQKLEGLRTEHPVASTVGELGGALAPALIPGGAEAEAARFGAAGADSLLTAEEASSLTGSGLKQAADAAKQIAIADAQKGRTLGSSLARTLRAVNPYEYTGAAGASAGNTLARVLGSGKAAKTAGALTRYATEGALIGAASAADEAEIGPEDLTGEALLAGAAHGALWGTGLGLVGTGAEKILTSAARVADRLAEGQIGGTPKQAAEALRKFGPGSRGRFMHENGWSPLMNAEQQYDWASRVQETKGNELEMVVKDADQAFEGVSAAEVRNAAHDAMKAPVDQYGFAGGNAPALKNRMAQEVDDGIGWWKEPEAPPVISTAEIEHSVKREMSRTGLKIPRQPSRATIDRAVKEQIALKGFDHPITEQMEHEKLQELTGKIVELRNAGKQEEAGKLLQQVMNVRQVMEQERMQGIASIEAARPKMFQEAMMKYGDELRAYEAVKADKLMQAHMEQSARQMEYEHLLRATQEHNANLKVGFEKLREIRKRFDDVIPWTYANARDGVTSAANEVKLAARHALESKVEEGLDRAVVERTEDTDLHARYLHGKRQYAIAADIAKAAEKGRAREATWFGRPTRVGGVAGHVMLGSVGALAGHPLAGIGAGVGYGVARHYGPRLAAWVLHKASRLAAMKALSQEVQIATRRSVRSSMGVAEPRSYAKVRLDDLNPHEMRQTAADAMEKVAGLGRDMNGLRGRLAALDPSAPIVAPKAFAQAEGAFRRAVTWLSSQIPPRIISALATGQKVNPRDLSDDEARNFLEHASVAVDPRVATDALANGTLSVNQAKAFRYVWPAMTRSAHATLQRISMMDRDSLDFVHPTRREQLSMMLGGADAKFTLALQSAAAASVGGAPQMGGGMGPMKGAKVTGMTHAAATSMGTAVALSATQAQAVEAGPPGRRGKKTAGSDFSGF